MVALPLGDDGPLGWPTSTGLHPRIVRPYVPDGRPGDNVPQRTFLCLRSLEAFYGGAAGGGKSDALLMAALQFVDVPGYAALILRKTYPDLALPGALLDRARDWLLDTPARWSAAEHTWHFPSTATLTFGYVEHRAQVMRYRSAEFQFIGLDETTQHDEFVYTYLFSRLRRPADRVDLGRPTADGLTLSTIPLRMRSGSNPGDVGHAWVRRRLVDPATRAPGVVFVPARLEDNPYLDRDEYDRALAQGLDPVEHARLRRGDWDVRNPGEVFDKANVEVVDAPWPPGRRYRRVRYWDLASTARDARSANDPDWTVGTLLALDDETGLWRVEHQVAVRAEPHVVEQHLVGTAHADGRDVPIVVEQEPGSEGKHFVSYLRRHVLRGYRVEGDRVTGPKETRIRALAPVVANRELSVVAGPWTLPLLDEVDAYPHVEHDDRVDSLAGAHRWLSGPGGRVLV